MSFGFLDLYTQKVSLGGGADPDMVALAQTQPPLGVAGFSEMTSLGYRSARAELPDFLSSRTFDMYEDAIDKARKATGKTLLNPHVEPAREAERRRRSIASTFLNRREEQNFDAFPQRQERFFAEYDALRKEHPDLPDVRGFRDKAIEELKKRRAEFRAADVGSTGLGDIGGFVGQVGADLQHPANLATLPLGAPAILYSPVRAGIMAGIGRILGVGAVEGSIAAATQAVIETDKVPRLQSYGVKYDWDEAWGNILGAAGAGFVLGGGLRTMVAGWRAARGGIEGDTGAAARMFADARRYHPDIGDAEDGVRVAERLLLHEEARPARATPAAHDEAMAEATAAVVEGRAPDVQPILAKALDDVRAEGEAILAEARRTARAAETLPEAPTKAPAAPSRAVAPPSSPMNALFTPTGRRVEVGYEVVDIRTLIPSHTDEFQVNAAFPASLQPRDRARAASKAQVAEIAGRLEPERLGPSPDATTGAPIVARDNVVESGNGRVLAIRRAYAEGGADGYRDWLKKQGYDVDGIEYPVLVARRETPLSEAEREAFVREANASAAARMAVSEQAASDARLIAPIIDLWKGGDVTFQQNADFVRAFLKGLPGSERGALWTEKGGLSQEGARRVQAALLHAAYGDAPLVAKLMEAPSNDIKAIGGALMDVAPAWAQMRERVRKGEIAPDVDRTADLIGAVRVIEDARQKGVIVSDLLDQGGLFDSPEPTRLFVGMMYQDPALRRAAGRQAVADRLKGYIDEANKTSAGPDLFGAPPPTAKEILVATDKQRILANLVDDAKEAKEAAERQKPEPGKAPPPVEPEVLVKEIEGIKAFHGSPHRFEKFSISKIGTGEGAQSFGYGLYFAENAGVAQSYKVALSDLSVGGQPFNFNRAEHLAAGYLHLYGSKKAAIRQLGESIPQEIAAKIDLDDYVSGAHASVVKEAKALLRSGAELPEIKVGRLYEVVLREREGKFLDWDKTIGEQTSEVRAAIERFAASEQGLRSPPSSMKAGDWLDAVENHFQNPPAVSAALHKEGVAGVRYLDAASRAAGQGTHNYVVFDDSIIDIVKIDGIVQRVKTLPEARALDAELAKAQDKALSEIAADPKAESLRGAIDERRAEHQRVSGGTRPTQEGEGAGAKPAVQPGNRAGDTANAGKDAAADEVSGAGQGQLKPAEAKVETARRTVADEDVPTPVLDGEGAASGRALLDEADADVRAAEIIRNCAIGAAI